MVQVPTGMALAPLPEEKLTLPAPATGANVPPQVFVAPGGLATTRLPGTAPTPEGRVSVKLPSTGITFGLFTLRVSVLAVFVATVAGTKVLVIFSGSRMMIPTSAEPPLPAPSAPGAV